MILLKTTRNRQKKRQQRIRLHNIFHLISIPFSFHFQTNVPDNKEEVCTLSYTHTHIHTWNFNNKTKHDKYLNFSPNNISSICTRKNRIFITYFFGILLFIIIFIMCKNPIPLFRTLDLPICRHELNREQLLLLF